MYEILGKAEEKRRFSLFKGSTEVAPNKKSTQRLPAKCLILMESISGLEPLTY
jgi:hypothetical protein